MARFLLFADAHYTTKPLTGNRRHPLSLDKLRRAVAADGRQCDRLINLGDTTDAAQGYLPQTECFSRMTQAMEESGLPCHSLIGNHDTATDKATVTAVCHMPGRYYAADLGSHLGLFLDGSMNGENAPYPHGIIDWERCYVDTEQQLWLRQQLQMTAKPVLVFCHPCFALKDGWAEELHLLRNREPLMEAFAESGKVAAVFCGHYHPGDARLVGGIPYITMAAMCEGEENTYAVVTVEPGEVRVDGRGRQPSLRFPQVGMTLPRVPDGRA